MYLPTGDCMSSTRDELDHFHQFVLERLARSDSTVSLEELFVEWHDCQSREEINRAIRQGLADVEARRYQPAANSIESIRQELGFAKE
jgi:hypothetical protein